MGTKCNYFSTMEAISLIELSADEKTWLQHYGDMPEHMCYREGSIYELLKEMVEKQPDAPALEYFDTVYSFEALDENINMVANALKRMGVVEDESVTVCMPNVPEAIFLIYAINKIGAVANVIHPLSDVNEIRNAVSLTDSNLIFTTDVSYGTVSAACVQNIVVCEVSNSMPTVLKTLYNIKSRKQLKYGGDAITWKKFISDAGTVSPSVKRNKNDAAVLIYSGGTTGKSKGIVLSNLCFNALAIQCIAVCPEAKPGASMLSALPIFHGFGLCVSVHAPICLGMKCILIPKIDVKKLNETIKKKKPTILPAVPTMLKAITNNKNLGPDSLKSVKVILSGGDYLSDDLRAKVIDYFRSCGSKAHIRIGYGLSEATAFFTATAYGAEDIDNIGIPNPDTQIRVCAPDTNEKLPDGEIGEICVNGPTVMLGYVNDKEETDNAIRTHSDGTQWLHTGDLGYLDNGVLHFTSRLKRMIISNGYNIYPTELENILNKCKYVASSVVVGIKDKVREEAPKAVIVLKNGVQRTAEIEKEIKDFCKKNIAKNAQFKEIEFTDALPTTKIGKINYRMFEKKKEKENSETKEEKETVTVE